jgi:hypothetical protein
MARIPRRSAEYVDVSAQVLEAFVLGNLNEIDSWFLAPEVLSGPKIVEAGIEPSANVGRRFSLAYLGSQSVLMSSCLQVSFLWVGQWAVRQALLQYCTSRHFEQAKRSAAAVHWPLLLLAHSGGLRKIEVAISVDWVRVIVVEPRRHCGWSSVGWRGQVSSQVDR